MAVERNPMIKVVLATREKCKASVMIEGLSGKGKSGLALAMAYALVKDWDKVGDVDTEKKSINLYNGVTLNTGVKVPAIKKVELTADIGFKPTNYLACQDALIEAGCEVVIKDSVSHAWSYKGGILDMVAELKATGGPRYAKDQYAAWGEPSVVKEKNELLELLRDERVHNICTVRVKEKMEYDKNEEGKTVLNSLGEQQIMQGDIKFEPDLVISMISPGYTDPATGVVEKHPVGRIVKSRYAIFKVDEIYTFTPEILNQLAVYLDEGVDPGDLLEQQRQDYIEAVKTYIKEKPAAKFVWETLKEDAGHKATKLVDMPLKVLKQLFSQLTAD